MDDDIFSEEKDIMNMDKDILNFVLLFLRIISIKNNKRNSLSKMFELQHYEINIYRNEFEKNIHIHLMT